MEKNNFFEVISIKFIILFIICYILFSAFFIQGVNKNKATADDYKLLYEQAETIKSNFKSIKDMDNVRCTFTNNLKIITLESKRCSLVLFFNDDFTKINECTEQSDSVSVTYVLMLSFMFTLFIMLFISTIFDYIKNRRK